MFKIGEFSKFTKVSPRMLRYYDEVGLFKPSKIDKSTGYRYYSANQIPKLIKIITFRDIGFNISEISELLKVQDENYILMELKRKKYQFEENINNELKIIDNIDRIISLLEEELFSMDYEVKLKEVPSCKVVSIRAIVENYSKEIDLWAMLGEFAQRNKLQPTGTPFAIYHDGEHKENNVDIEVTMPVAKLQENKGKFIFRKIEPIPLAATILYKGRYENIDEAFFFLAKWIEDSNYAPYGAVHQVSIKGEWNESNPDNYLVEIQMPVKKLIK